MSYTLGTHNLHDHAGEPTFFADAILFTEAIAPTIRAKVAIRWRFAKLRLRGYRVVTCRQQRDLVWAGRRRLFAVKGQTYDKYVDGRPGVTPHRGTWCVFCVNRDSGDSEVFMLEHRINAAFEPWIRGEAAFRTRAWLRQTAGSIDTAMRLKHNGHRVNAGGDPNTPPDELAYRGRLHEVGRGLDRLASTARLTNVRVLSRKGSDHHRLVATVQED